jgi:hypothetical protein
VTRQFAFVLAATVVAAVVGAPPALAATTLVVATNGNDSNPGTVAAPLATLARAVNLATPGTTITLRGGTYSLTTNVRIMKDGTASSPYTMSRSPTARTRSSAATATTTSSNA